MTTYNFDSFVGQTISFDPDADVLAVLHVADQVRLSQSGTNLEVQVINVGTVTLTGVTLGQMTTTNLSAVSSVVQVGDNTTNSSLDDLGQTVISEASGTNNNNLVYGMGGGDTITLQNGDNVVFGGNAATDADDTGTDTITVGTGSNQIYANAGGDSITINGTASGETTSVFGGLGNDTIAGAGASTGGNLYINVGPDTDTVAFANAVTGNVTVIGGGGTDTLSLANVSGDATLYGGTGGTDSTDGADTIGSTGTGNLSAFLNAGNDTVTGVGGANKTQTINLGRGNDTFQEAGAADGNFVIAGGWDDDSINLTDTDAENATIYGGNGLTDASDGADTITVNVGGNTSVYGNSGNDVIAVTLEGGFSGIVNGGLGDDTISAKGDDVAGGADAALLLTGAAGNDVFNIDLSTNADGAEDGTATITDFSASEDTVNVTLTGGDTAAGVSVTRTGSSTIIASTTNTSNAIVLSNFLGNFDGTNFVLSGGGLLKSNFDGAAATMTGSNGTADQLLAGSNGDTLVGDSDADKLIGGSGNDVFQFTAARAGGFNGTAVTITGGDGTDTLQITDTNAATLAANDFTSTITQMETLLLSNAAHNVTLGTAFATAGFTTINADALAGTTAITVDGSGATAAFTFDADGATSTGAMEINTGAGNDVISTGSGNDLITLIGGNDSVSGGAGDDTITVAIANLTSNDTLAGGSGTADNITLSDISTGANAVVDSDFTNVTGIERLILANGGGAQTVTLGTAASAAGLVRVDGSAEVGHALTITASSMTTGLEVIGGDTADSITGGSGNDTLYGGGNSAADTLIGGSGSDRYAFTANGTANGTDIIDSSNFTVGSSGDIFDFDYQNSTFGGSVTETITNTATAAGVGNNGILVYTTDAVGNAAAMKAVLDATDLDTTNVANRIVVWEVDANTVGVGVFNNADTDDDDDITVTQVASLTNFADQTAVDTFTSGLVAGNFDLI